jgi:hypothetical protein
MEERRTAALKFIGLVIVNQRAVSIGLQMQG